MANASWAFCRGHNTSRCVAKKERMNINATDPSAARLAPEALHRKLRLAIRDRRLQDATPGWCACDSPRAGAVPDGTYFPKVEIGVFQNPPLTTQPDFQLCGSLFGCATN